MNRDGLRDALSHSNVRAFLRAIRNGESSQEESAYRLENGGRVLPECPVEHPSKGLKSPPGKAFGAYQFLASTWAGLVRQYGFPDMSPDCQDEAAVALIAERRGALDAVLAGRFDDACRILHPVWTSLPGGSEENKLTAKARATYEAWGGAFFNPDSLETEHYEAPMAPLILPLLQVAAQFLPQLAEKFGSGSEVSNRNIAAGKVLADAIVTATSSPNLQAAVEKMAADPEAVKAAKAAVAQEWPELFEAGGGGIDGARKANSAPEVPLWFDRAFLIGLVLMAAVFMLLVDVFYVHPDNYDANIRVQIVTGVLGFAGIVGAYFLGSSFGSQRKTNILANKE